MFRNVSSGQSSASSAGHGGAPPGLDSQESPWIGLFSVLSRPALSLLNRILPGRTRTAALLDRDSSGWLNGVLDDGSYLQAEHGGAAALLEAGPDSCLQWLPADMGHLEGLEGLGQLGDLDLGQQTQLKSLSTIRARLHQVLLSSQNLGARGSKEWGPSRGTNWWGDLCAGEGTSDGALLQHMLWMEPAARTSSIGSGDLGLLSDLCPLGSKTGIKLHDSAPPPADQDHGYSSLEEEQVYKGPPLMATPPSEEVPQQGAFEEETAEEEEVLEAPRCQNRAIAFIMGCPCSDDDQSESSEDDRGFDSDGSSASCDSSSDSDDDDDDEEEEEEEELEEEEEMDEESQRLWNSMSRSLDPYNPQNFCACLQTGTSSSSPRDVPATSSSPSSTSLPLDVPAAASSPRDVPATSPSSSSSSPLDVPATSSPPDCASSWDDSASEVDEAETLLLWSSFSCSSDPYSPLNFQAPLRTRAPPAAPLRTPFPASASPPLRPAAPPRYRKEEAEERLDSGFSEPSSSSSSHRCRVIKKVRFSEHVEEFFASGGEEEEERRGPWEELARDRCRFMRRCLEVEQSISFCLQEQHRRDVYQRLAANQDSLLAAEEEEAAAAAQ